MERAIGETGIPLNKGFREQRRPVCAVNRAGVEERQLFVRSMQL